jgi:hypothetical protein
MVPAGRVCGLILAAGMAFGQVTVPFVGCKSDGQVGPREAPAGKPKAVALPAEVAGRLAFYKAEIGGGVLAPRGWYCFGTYGSGGSNLLVSPVPIDAARIFTRDWEGLPGSGLELRFSDGGTSGRFHVAEIIDRVFPDYRKFADQVNEIFESKPPGHFGPYPTDKLTYRSSRLTV